MLKLTIMLQPRKWVERGARFLVDDADGGGDGDGDGGGGGRRRGLDEWRECKTIR